MNPDSIDEDLEDADSTAILVGILAELREQNALLRELADVDTTQDGESDQEAAMYECDMCGAYVDGDERMRHLRGKHSAPVGAIDVGGKFSEL